MPPSTPTATHTGQEKCLQTRAHHTRIPDKRKKNASEASDRAEDLIRSLQGLEGVIRRRRADLGHTLFVDVICHGEARVAPKLQLHCRLLCFLLQLQRR